MSNKLYIKKINNPFSAYVRNLIYVIIIEKYFNKRKILLLSMLKSLNNFFKLTIEN